MEKKKKKNLGTSSVGAGGPTQASVVGDLMFLPFPWSRVFEGVEDTGAKKRKKFPVV